MLPSGLAFVDCIGFVTTDRLEATVSIPVATAQPPTVYIDPGATLLVAVPRTQSLQHQSSFGRLSVPHSDRAARSVSARITDTRHRQRAVAGVLPFANHPIRTGSVFMPSALQRDCGDAARQEEGVEQHGQDPGLVALGRRIRSLRERARLSQTELGRPLRHARRSRTSSPRPRHRAFVF